MKITCVKAVLTFVTIVLFSLSIFAQSPEKISYQAVIRNASDQLVSNTNVGIQISILQGSSSGTPVFVERHFPTTNINGLVSLEIGDGALVSGNLSTIDWANGPYFLKAETDLNGGSTYTISGTTQLLSVPYALHATTADSVSGGINETDPVFNASIAAGITGTDTAYWNNKLDVELDGSTTNELQVLSISNDTIYLSDGGYAKLPASFDGDWGSLTGTPPNVSTFTNDAGYLTSEVDGSVTNELQVLSISNDTIYLSDGGFAKLPVGFDGDYNSLNNRPDFTNWDIDVTDDFDGQYSSLTGTPTNVSAFTNDAGYLISEVDGDNSNELQVLSISNDTIYLSDGGYAKLPAGFDGDWSSLTGTPPNVSTFTNDAGYLTSEVDGSVTNELQVLSISNDTIYLTDGGFVKLSVATILADADNDTKIQVEESTDEDIIRFDVGGTEKWVMIGSRLEAKNTGMSVFIGFEAGLNDDLISNYNTLIGYRAGKANTSGFENTAIGNFALSNNTTGIFNTANGGSSLMSNTTGKYNAAIGSYSLPSNTTGSNNTACGYWSLLSNTSGYSNTAVGTHSLNKNTTRSNLVAIGDSALYNNGTGATGTTQASRNTALGSKAMFSNTTGFFNTASGFESLYSNTSGNSNTANGYSTLYSNTTGVSNSAFGFVALGLNDDGHNNTAIGFASMASNTSGHYNSALGVLSLYSNTTGTNNTTFGYLSMRFNTTGYSNVAIGTNSLYNNTTRSNLVAIGDSALYNNGTGVTLSWHATRNTAVGSKTLYANTTGYDNTAGGSNALYSNTTGVSNTANGSSALSSNTTGNNNTAIGAYTLLDNTTGYNNVAVGNNALRSNTTGYYNTASGVGALQLNTTGYYNTANGYNSLRNNTIGYHNTAMGYYSLYSNTTGDYNTAIGYYALYSNTDGLNNYAIGWRALEDNLVGDENVAIGTNALSDITNSYNTAVGGRAGDYLNVNTTSSLYLGYDADASSTAGAYNYSVAIGQRSRVSASQQVRIGNGTSNAATSIGGPVGWSTVSDGRFKDNVQDNVPGIEFITKLRPVTYNFDNEKLNDYINTPDSCRDRESSAKDHQIVRTGFIAQEVEQAAKECGFNFSGVDAPKNENDYYGIRYAEFVVPLVKATQEQQEIIEEQDQINKEQQQTIEDQNQVNEQQQQTIEQQQQTIENLLERIEALEEQMNQ